MTAWFTCVYPTSQQYTKCEAHLIAVFLRIAIDSNKKWMNFISYHTERPFSTFHINTGRCRRASLLKLQTFEGFQMYIVTVTLAIIL